VLKNKKFFSGHGFWEAEEGFLPVIENEAVMDSVQLWAHLRIRRVQDDDLLGLIGRQESVGGDRAIRPDKLNLPVILNTL
jgi:hypothetical protein